MSVPFEVMAAQAYAKAALAAGLARPGTFQLDDLATPVPCTVTLNMDTQEMSSLGTAPILLGRSAQIALQRSEIAAAPVRGNFVVVDGVKFVIDKLENVQPGFWLTLCTNKGAP